ncbi:MAG: hypothetical protein PGN26_14110 [Xylophilus ampelinus]
MKYILAAALAFAVPGIACAQTASTDKAPAKKAAAAKPAPAKPAAKAAAQKKPRLARSAAKAVETVTPISDEPSPVLSEADLDVAKRVYTGHIACELGNSVTITPDEKHPGYFAVQNRKVTYRMHPVESRTGAIRLEDVKAGAMWLQLGNKSMLMNQKEGLRLADECQNPDQVAMSDAMKKAPPTRGLLDAPDAPIPAQK